MTVRSVFALSQGRYELFLGYSSADEDDPRALLADVFPTLSERRSALFSELQRGIDGAIFIYARDLESDDPLLDATRKNSYLHDGSPYIHDLSIADLKLLRADGTTLYIERREADHAVPVALAPGRVVFCTFLGS